MPDVTRIIEQKATESIYNDDWALIDRPTEGEDGGTRKILVSRLKELLCGDYIADEWVAGETYTNGAIVSHEGKLYYNKSGGTLVHTTFNSNSWLEVKIDELLEKVIGSVGEKWRLVDTYHYDDLVVYGGRLYRCIKNASTQGTWVSNEWIEANAEYYFKKVREYIARYGFIPSREAVSSPYNKGDLILYRAPGDTTNSLYMRLNDTENGDPTWIPENWLKVENIGGALSKIYDDMEESSCDVQIKEQSIIDENKVADLTSLAMVGSASGAIASFDDGSDLPMPKLEVAIEPQQEGSGAPSPENIRPISGWDEVDLSVSGVNLFDKATIKDGYINDATGAVEKGGGAKCTDFILIKADTSYYVKTEQTSGMWGAWYDENQTYISGVTGYGNKVITAPSNAFYVRLTVLYYNNGNIDTFDINYPSTDTSYHAYNGQTYTIQFTDGDNPLTVYGGSLDVVSGELKVVPYYASYNGETLEGEWISDRDVYAVGTTPTIGAQVVNIGATPQTYQLTPTQVNSLLGVNNIWADTGDVLDAEYIRDATTIINSLIARIEVLENS